ncbi:MAG: hypothetical protein O2992_03040 [Gemmatimonadetes bacterium]|jgi:hypothetical protein|nr:hypothetical protein [Gemmatimonadota bacterium]
MTDRDLLRHIVATIAYRGGKALRGAPPGFGSVSAGEGTRSAVQILSHVGDLFAWGLALADGEHRWSEFQSDDWEVQVERFHAGLEAVEARLASSEPLGRPSERLLQGPFADALTHVGQLAMLRRLAGSPVKGENYFKAEVTVGVVGPDQPLPVYEF